MGAQGAEACNSSDEDGLPHPAALSAVYGAIAKGQTWQATEQNPHP